MKKKLWHTSPHHVDKLIAILNKSEGVDKKAKTLIKYFNDEHLMLEQQMELLVLLISQTFGNDNYKLEEDVVN